MMIVRWTITAVLSILVHAGGASSRISSSPSEISAPRMAHLPVGHQLQVFMKRNETRRFKLISEAYNLPLSIAVTPCSSPVIWSVLFLNSSSGSSDTKAMKIFQSESDFMDTFKIDSTKAGTYITEITPLLDDTGVQIFASQKPFHEQKIAQKTKVKLQKKQDRRRITVKWDQSPIDPHITEYCLVVSSARNYSSLCGASGDRYGPYGHGPSLVRGNTSKMGRDSGKVNDLIISCVGPKTYHSVDNLESGKKYFLTLFAVNTQNNMTFPYGSTTVVYDERVKHSRLRDGKAEKVNLKELDGKAVFKYKTGKQSGSTMTVTVMPCGGAVDVVVALRGNVVARRNKLYSYGQLQIREVKRGQRYTIKVLASNGEELKRTSGVEVLATSSSSRHQLPLPQLPSEPIVVQYANSCDSVTVGWLPSPDAKTVRYCVVIRERDKDGEPRQPNQCTLEKRLHKRPNYNSMKCRNLKTSEEKNKVMVEEIKGLKPDKKYMVQVTVSKPGGRTLSYDLLTAKTSSKCQ